MTLCTPLVQETVDLLRIAQAAGSKNGKGKKDKSIDVETHRAAVIDTLQKLLVSDNATLSSDELEERLRLAIGDGSALHDSLSAAKLRHAELHKMLAAAKSGECVAILKPAQAAREGSVTFGQGERGIDNVR